MSDGSESARVRTNGQHTNPAPNAAAAEPGPDPRRILMVTAGVVQR